ncbi:chromate transporter, partial [Streptomyces globisporus]|uniref:chromate transporter n=1 Tax=Streptomyces globisporus TaxID=1908 RepID=UPI00055D1028
AAPGATRARSVPARHHASDPVRPRSGRPGPAVQTVAVVGYAAAGLAGGLRVAIAAFAPTFAMVIVDGPRFDSLRAESSVQAFLTGAGPAVIGAVAGSALPSDTFGKPSAWPLPR